MVEVRTLLIIMVIVMVGINAAIIFMAWVMFLKRNSWPKDDKALDKAHTR